MMASAARTRHAMVAEVAHWAGALRQLRTCSQKMPEIQARVKLWASSTTHSRHSSACGCNSCGVRPQVPHHFQQQRNYHGYKGGLGEIKGAAPRWGDSQWFTHSEKLYTQLGRKENGGIGPDLYQRDYGGMGGDYIPVDYDPDLAVKFPQYATVDSVNFEEIMYAKEEFVRKERNASQPLEPIPMPEERRVLDVDPLCGSKSADFVFTDISHGSTRKNRRIFIREQSGTLRTADQAERDDVYQMYFATKREKKRLPTIFKNDQDLLSAMNNFAHAYLLDGLCRMRPSDSPDYTSNHIKIYSHINQIGAFQVLQDTPHFQGFIKYLVANANINKLMQALLKTGRKDSAADLVRALVETNPGSRLSKNVVKALDLTKATPKGEPHAIHGTDSATVLSKYVRVVGDPDMEDLLAEL